MYRIDEVIRVEVDGWQLDDDMYDKTIKQVNLTVAENDHDLAIDIQFNSPANITTDISEPDQLNVDFLLPNLILDAADNSPFESETLFYKVELQP